MSRRQSPVRLQTSTEHCARTETKTRWERPHIQNHAPRGFNSQMNRLSSVLT